MRILCFFSSVNRRLEEVVKLRKVNKVRGRRSVSSSEESSSPAKKKSHVFEWVVVFYKKRNWLFGLFWFWFWFASVFSIVMCSL